MEVHKVVSRDHRSIKDGQQLLLLLLILLSSVVVVVVVIVSYRIPQSYLAARLLRFAFVSIPFRSWLCPQNIYATKV